jgi:hypothetical protein
MVHPGAGREFAMNQLPLEMKRPVWQAPKLQELGNLRHFVRVGQANGKSTNDMDGSSNCGNEAKNGAGDCTHP